MNEQSVFMKIINGEIPCHKVYENEKTLAFLDINPAAVGHVLVVPKVQVEFIWDLDDENYQAVMTTVKLVGRRVREVTGATYVGEMVVGTDVPHVHVHIIPFETSDTLTRAIARPVTEPDHDALKITANALRFS